MILRGKAIGVIRVYKGEEHKFTEDEVYFVSLVANLGAIALENARLYDRLHENYKSLQGDILEWRATFGEEWISKEPEVVAHRWWKFI